MIIPDGLEEIGQHWFVGSKMESLLVSASVRAISEEAFNGCENLKTIEFA